MDVTQFYGRTGEPDPEQWIVQRCRVVALLGIAARLGRQTGQQIQTQFEVVVAITAKCPAI